MHNPSLREEPWGGPATVVPMTDTVSILDWLRQQGRLIERGTPTDLDAASPPEEDITLLMGEEEADDDAFDDGGFDDDDED